MREGISTSLFLFFLLSAYFCHTRSFLFESFLALVLRLLEPSLFRLLMLPLFFGLLAGGSRSTFFFFLGYASLFYFSSTLLFLYNTLFFLGFLLFCLATLIFHLGFCFPWCLGQAFHWNILQTIFFTFVPFFFDTTSVRCLGDSNTLLQWSNSFMFSRFGVFLTLFAGMGLGFINRDVMVFLRTSISDVGSTIL